MYTSEYSLPGFVDRLCSGLADVLEHVPLKNKTFDEPTISNKATRDTANSSSQQADIHSNTLHHKSPSSSSSSKYRKRRDFKSRKCRAISETDEKPLHPRPFAPLGVFMHLVTLAWKLIGTRKVRQKARFWVKPTVVKKHPRALSINVQPHVFVVTLQKPGVGTRYAPGPCR